MDYKELLEKYNLLLSENSRLIKENDKLKVQLGIPFSADSMHNLLILFTPGTLCTKEGQNRVT